MAMLAERRERKRYNLVPRGKALYEDSDRFGTRMLEKMGWTKGKGLGANESGEKEFVRVRYKNDSAGLGFEDRNDQWTQHESEFEKLLKKLGDDGEHVVSTENVNAEEDDNSKPTAFGFGFKVDSQQAKQPMLSGESLEEKSKKSRARVHYMKFTRGKDISRYSEKDLANIFGRKRFVTYGAENIEEVKGSAESSQTPSDDEKEIKAFGVTTIKSETSVNDYFKAKMETARIKQKRNSNKSIPTDMENIDNTINPFIENPEKKKKKKHKHIDSETHSIVEAKSEDCSGVSLDTKKTKKSKKKKYCDEQVCESEEASDMEQEKTIFTQEIKKNRNAQDIQGHNVEQKNISSNNDDSNKKRTKKLNENVDRQQQICAYDVENNDSKERNKEVNIKKENKKCKKREDEDEMICIEGPRSEDVNEFSMCSKKPKKAKKHRKEDESDIQEQISVADCDECETNTFDKKSLKQQKCLNTDYKMAEIESESKTKKGKTTSENCTVENVTTKTNDGLGSTVIGLTNCIEVIREVREQVHQKKFTSGGTDAFQFPELNMRVRKRKPSKQPRIEEKVIKVKQTSDEIENITRPEEDDSRRLTISENSAAEFCNVNIDGFPGSNWCDIVGYGLSGRIKIEIKFEDPRVITPNYILFDNTAKNTIHPSIFNEETTKLRDGLQLGKLKKKKRSAFPILI